MDVIQLLPDSVANQIAAGEVIQRPASVIKELVENSIDAGATKIQVLVCDAGKASIQVIDDGKGMSDTDARLSFERHATSKIRQAQDLFALHTMGFRGEALASIAAVAQVTLQTRTADDEIGTRLVIAGSHVQSQEPTACPVGSNFLIENLFFNIPARRKFLKSNATEMTNIMQAFERIALVYPEIAFTLYSNGSEVLNLRASNIHQRIVDIFGKRINQQLLAVETQTTICDITGFVGKPESAKKKGCHQYFFVNGRYMKHPYFHKAVMSAFDRLLPDGEQVSYFLYLNVDPQDIDVNIHPVKTEIKFDNEQAIWQILMAAVRDAVGTFSEVTSLDFDTEGKPDIPVFNPDGNPFVEAPRIDFNPQYNPFTQAANESSSAKPGGSAAHSAPHASHQPAFPSSQPSARGWEELFGGTEPTANVANNNIQRSTIFDDLPETVEKTPAEQDVPQTLSQYRASYILAESATGLMMIDQHRASERVLYEQFMKSLQTRSAHTQKVLFPDMVQFPPSYIGQLGTILDELCAMGFEITDLGGGTYSVAGIPAGLGGLDAVSLVNELVAEAMERGGGITEQLHSILAQTLAKRAATPYGEILSSEDMDTLVKQLFGCSAQRYTADGRKIIHLLGNDDLESWFG